MPSVKGANAPPTIESVRSSYIAGIGYAPQGKYLFIQFHSGVVVRHANVSPELYQQIMDAPTRGRFYHSTISRKKDYPLTYLPDDWRDDSKWWTPFDMELGPLPATDGRDDLLHDAYLEMRNAMNKHAMVLTRAELFSLLSKLLTEESQSAIRSERQLSANATQPDKQLPAEVIEAHEERIESDAEFLARTLADVP